MKNKVKELNSYDSLFLFYSVFLINRLYSIGFSPTSKFIYLYFLKKLEDIFSTFPNYPSLILP